MKTTSICTAILLLLVISALPVSANSNPVTDETHEASSPDGIPLAFVKDSQYQFAPVLEGVEVAHEFIVENTGTAPLIIDKIVTGCGCTTADYTKTIAPGEKGNITLKARTNGYGGRMFERHVRVFTNDPKNEVINILVTGKVEQFVGIAPSTAVLRGSPDETVETIISVTPNKKYPFHITGTRMDKVLENKVEYELEKLDTGDVVLRVKNLLQKQGQYHGHITLQTDNPNNREIRIRVIGRIG